MIKGLSDRRRLPRAGVIRLGIKIKEPGKKEYPKETDYFVLPDSIKDQFEHEPKSLKIMFPIESEQVFFQQFLKKYGNGVLLCRGDGENGTFFNFEAGAFVEKKCPCEDLEKGRCKQVGVLQFLLPEVEEPIGVWQISTSSGNSIVDVNSGIDLVRSLAGRVRMIPLILSRELTKTNKLQKGGPIKGTHYTLRLKPGMSIVKLQQLGQASPHIALLPAPNETHEAVDDLFPPSGFDKKDDIDKETEQVEKIEKETKPEEPVATMEDIKDESDLLKLKKELSGIMEEIKEVGRELTDAEAVKLDSLITVTDYKTKITYWNRELRKLRQPE